MLNCVIIDDDFDFAAQLKSQLDSTLGLNVLATAGTVAGGIELLNKCKPDLVFLDMELPDGNGFEILEGFRELAFHLIIISAHDEFALRAIKFSAIDYLLKPFPLQNLSAAVQKVKALGKHRSREILNSYLDNSSNPDLKKRKLGVSTMNDIFFVDVQDIVFCKADGSYTELVFIDNRHPIISSKPIKYFEDLLEEYEFYRPHKSYLVNLQHISGFSRNESMLLSSTNHKIPVSRQRRESLLAKIAVF